MIFHITTEAAIRKYLQLKIAEQNDLLASETSEEDVGRGERVIQHLQMCENLLDIAIRNGKASASFKVSDDIEGQVAFSVRKDGLVRCFESTNMPYDAEPKSESCDISEISRYQNSARSAEKSRSLAKDENNAYGVAYFNSLYEYKTAIFRALEMTVKGVIGSADVTIDGERVAHVEGVRDGKKVTFTVFPVFRKYFSVFE